MKRIHVVGSSPRTGTTLMVEMLIAGFHIDGYASHEISIFARPPRGYRIYCSKNPRDLLAVGPLLSVDPELWVIHMVRDPRDVVVSKHRNDPDRYWTNLRIWNERQPVAIELEEHPRFLTVRYEDLVEAPNAVQQQLARFLPFLEVKASFDEFHQIATPDAAAQRALGGVRPVDRQSIGKWNKHKARLAGQLLQHGSIQADLERLGYETDDAWLRELDGVEPDLTPSHFPEESRRAASRNAMNLGRLRRVLRYIVERALSLR